MMPMNDQPRETDIFDRMKSGGPIRKDDPQYGKFGEVVSRTIRLCVQMNAQATDLDDVRKKLGEIIGTEIDESTTVFPPFYTNFGRSISLGKTFLSIMPAHFWILAALPLKMMYRLAPGST
jgi:hypothetical protein